MTGHQDQQHCAGDLSFIAPYIDGVEKLGAPGTGAHPPNESVNLPALTMQTERAALMLYRLSREKVAAVRPQSEMKLHRADVRRGVGARRRR